MDKKEEALKEAVEKPWGDNEYFREVSVSPCIVLINPDQSSNPSFEYESDSEEEEENLWCQTEEFKAGWLSVATEQEIELAHDGAHNREYDILQELADVIIAARLEEPFVDSECLWEREEELLCAIFCIRHWIYELEKHQEKLE